MRKTGKRVYVRKNKTDIPVMVYVTKNEYREMTKSGCEVCLYTDYQFECNCNNHAYHAQSRDDASIGLAELCQQLEKDGLQMRCCGTCLNYTIDWTAKHCFGGLYGFCCCEKDTQTPRTPEQIRLVINYCDRHVLKDDTAYDFISEHLYT